MVTVVENHIKHDGVSSTNFESSDALVDTSSSKETTAQFIQHEPSLETSIGLEVIESTDADPALLIQTPYLIQNETANTGFMDKKGTLEIIPDDEPLTASAQCPSFDNPTVLMQIQRVNQTATAADEFNIDGDEIALDVEKDDDVDALDVKTDDGEYQYDVYHGFYDESLDSYYEASDYGDNDESSSVLNAEIQRISEYSLPVAKLVLDEIHIQDATAILDLDTMLTITSDSVVQGLPRKKVQLFVFTVVGALVIAIAVALSIVLKNKDDSNSSASISPPSIFTVSLSFTPSMAPSGCPITRHDCLMTLITEQSGISLSVFRDKQSDRWKALDWLVTDLTASNFPYSNIEIIERFVLSLLYFASRGDDWNDSLSFRESSHICEWIGYLTWFRRGVTNCTANSRATVIDLSDNNLRGTLPSEIGLLTELEYINFENNLLTGYVPSFESLTKLKILHLNNNRFEGTLPDSLQKQDNLKEVYLYSNNLTGKLIDVINMTQLMVFDVHSNQFTGEVPTSYAKLQSLEKLNLEDNDLFGTVDFFCPELKRFGSNITFDCTGDDPEITCSCCEWCTFVIKNERN